VRLKKKSRSDHDPDGYSRWNDRLLPLEIFHAIDRERHRDQKFSIVIGCAIEKW